MSEVKRRALTDVDDVFNNDDVFIFTDLFKKTLEQFFSHIFLFNTTLALFSVHVWYSNEQRNEHFPNLSASEHTVIKSLEN